MVRAPLTPLLLSTYTHTDYMIAQVQAAYTRLRSKRFRSYFFCICFHNSGALRLTHSFTLGLLHVTYGNAFYLFLR